LAGKKKVLARWMVYKIMDSKIIFENLCIQNS
jgi:hypothetical protein